MSSQLRIESVYAEAFGGLRQRTLVLPDHPLVVVSGRNEAGKSSMATLMAWLLVGPWGEAVQAQRFGNYNDKVGGRLEGRLDGRTVEAEGSFKIISRGAPNESGLTVTVDGQQRTAAAWRTGDLHGIDSGVLQAIYSMTGVDLHEGDAVHRAVSNLAMGALAGAATAIELQEWLDGRRKQMLRATGRDDRSFAKLTTAINSLRDERNALSVDVTTYQQKVDELAEIVRRLDLIPDERAELQRQVTSHTTAAGVLGDKRTMTSLERELADLEDVSEAWATVVGRVVTLRSLRSEVERLDGECARVTDALDRAAAALGLSDDEVARLQVNAPDVTPLASLRGEVRLAESVVTTATGEVTRRQKAVEDCEKALRAAQVACPDMDVDALRAVRLDPPTQDELDQAITTLGLGEVGLDTARAGVATATRELEALDAALTARREHWASFRPDLSAEEWLANPARRTSGSSIGAPIVDPRIAYGVAAAVTVAAVLVLSRPIAAVAALVAIVAAFVVSRPRAGVAEEVVEDPAVREAALAVVDASRRRQAGDEAVGRTEGDLRGVESKVKDEAGRVMDLLGVLGIASVGTAAQHRARSRAVLGARGALAALDAADDELRAAKVELAEANTRLAARESELRETLTRCGVPERIDADTAVDLITDFQAVTQSRIELAGERTKLGVATDEFGSQLAPVSSDLAALSPADAVARVDQMAEVLDRRHELEKQIAGLRRTIGDRLGSDTLARQLVEDDIDEAELAAQTSVLKSHLDDLQAESDGLKRQEGELNAQMRELEKKDALAALQMEIGDLEDQRDQCLVDGVQALVAQAVLAEVAEEVRRRNQPALVTAASTMVCRVVPDWEELRVEQTAVDRLDVSVKRTDGAMVSAAKLSTGAQAVLYMALRLAAAEQDAARRNGLQFPILCDDPLVHLDDIRAAEAATLLYETAQRGHQVILFTCNGRTESLAQAAGAVVQPFG